MTAAEATLYILRRAAAGEVWRNESTGLCWMEHPITGVPTAAMSEFIHEIRRAGFLKFGGAADLYAGSALLLHLRGSHRSRPASPR